MDIELITKKIMDGVIKYNAEKKKQKALYIILPSIVVVSSICLIFKLISILFFIVIVFVSVLLVYLQKRKLKSLTKKMLETYEKIIEDFLSEREIIKERNRKASEECQETSKLVEKALEDLKRIGSGKSYKTIEKPFSEYEYQKALKDLEKAKKEREKAEKRLRKAKLENKYYSDLEKYSENVN